MEDFDSYATYVSNINDFTLMACEKLDVNPQDVKFLWSCDGGGGKTLITMDMFLHDGRHFTFIMLQSDGAPENYFNIKTLLELLNLPSFQFSFKFVGDGKLMAIILGLSASICVYMCPYCDGARYNKDGVATKKESSRRVMLELWVTSTTTMPESASNNFVEKIKIRDEVGMGSLGTPILVGHPPGPLHSNLIGSPNDLFKILRI